MTDHYTKAADLLAQLDGDPDGPDAHVLSYRALAHATLAAAAQGRPRRIVATPVKRAKGSGK